MKRRSLEAETLELNYFNELRLALSDHDPVMANELLQDAREHLESALADQEGVEVGVAQMQLILDELGSPTTYVSEAFQDSSSESSTVTTETIVIHQTENKRQRWAMVITIILLAIVIIYQLSHKGKKEIQIIQPTKAIKVSHNGEVKPENFKQFTITFDSELDLNRDYSEAIKFIPKVQGQTRLEGSKQLIYELKEDLKPANTYEIILGSDLIAKNGLKIEPKQWQLSTPRPKLLSVKQSRIHAHGDAQLALEFNQKVDPLQLKQNLSILDPESSPLSFQIETSKPNKVLYISLRRLNWTYVNCHIKAALVGTDGPLALLNAVERKVNLSPKLKLDSLKTHFQGASPVIRVRMNHSIELNKIKDYITISPKTDLNFEHHYRGFDILGDFKSGQRYQVQLLPGLPAGMAGSLEEEITRSLWFPDLPQSFGFSHQGGYLSSKNQLLLPIYTTNLEELQLKTKRLLPHNIVEWALDYSSYMSTSLAKDQPTHSIKIDNKKNDLIETVLPLETYLGQNQKGVFYFQLGHEDSYRRKSNLITISDLGLSVRKSKNDILVWVMSLVENKPIQQATVQLYDSKRTLIAQLTSDENGLCKTSLNNTQKVALVIVQKGEDMSYLNLSRSQLKRNSPHASNRAYLKDGYEVFSFSERDIYRAGDQLHLSAMIRDSKNNIPPTFPISINLLKPSGKSFLQKTVIANEHGMLYAKLNLPEHCQTGRYKVTYSLPSKPNQWLGSHSFIVKDFIPQTLKMEVSLNKKSKTMPKELSTNIKVNHLFGEPAKGLICNAEFTLSTQPIHFDKQWTNFQFGNDNLTPKNKEFNLSKQTLDQDGETQFDFSPNLNWEHAQIKVQSLIECLEKGGRALIESDEHTFPLWNHYLGMKAENAQPKNKEPQLFHFIQVDSQGELSQLTVDTTIEIVKINHQYVLRKKGRNQLQYIWEKNEELILKQSISFNEGKANFNWTPELAGEYQIRLNNKKAFGLQKTIFVQGEGLAWSMKEGASIKIVTDKSQYNIGDQAKVTLLAPFDGKALVTIESHEILNEQLVNIIDGKVELSYKVLGKWKPNIYLTATLVRGVQAEEQWHPHRASGVTSIQVNCSNHKLALSLESAPHIEPGKQLTVDIQAKEKGKAVKNAAVTLYAVDMGILNITKYKTPTPFDFFYQARRLDIHEYDMYQKLSPYLKKWTLANSLTPGGGVINGDFDLSRHLSHIKAKRVKPAIIFKDLLVSDENGRINTTLNIPEYIGELKIIAVANHQRAFGQTEKLLKVKSSLMVKSSWPRFVAPNDEFDVALSIFNQTTEEGQIDLNFEIDGPLQILSKPNQITVAGNQNKTIWITAKANQVGKVNLTLHASMGEHQFKDSLELPIRPTVKFTRQHGQQLLQGQGKHQIQLLGNYLEGTDKTKLYISNSATLNLAQSAMSLLKYPYGCAEQTVSRLVPLIYLHDLLQFIEPDLLHGQEIKNRIDAGLQRLSLLQTRSGALSMWPRVQKEEDYISIYAAYVLLEAQKSGWELPANLLPGLLDYLEDELSYWCQNKKNNSYPKLGQAAFATYVLAKAGKIPYSWLGHLENKFIQLKQDKQYIPTSAQYYLAAAQHIAGSDKALKELSQQPFNLQTKRYRGGFYQSNLRRKSILLSLLLDHEPSSTLIHNIAAELKEASLSNEKTTQEHAHMIFALGKLFRLQPSHPPEKVTYTLANGQSHEMNLQKGLSLDDLKSQQSLQINFHTSGNLYASWSTEGIPVDLKAKEADSGIKIRRTLLNHDGKEADFNQLTQGELYTIRLNIEAPDAIENIVISDLLPAGLETESPKFNSKHMNVLFFENRDDRNLVFCNTTQQSSQFEYKVRAVTSGTFTMPAIDIACMYDPSVFSVHGQKSIHIKKVSK